MGVGDVLPPKLESCPAHKRIFPDKVCYGCQGEFELYNPDVTLSQRLHDHARENPQALSDSDQIAFAEFEREKPNPGCLSCGHMLCQICAIRMKLSGMQCHCVTLRAR